MPTTYNDLYLNARRALLRAGNEAAQLEARELLCFVTGKDREQFYRDLRLYAPPAVEEQFLDLLRRRLSGEPTAYLIGEWQFYGMDLDIAPGVLIPRTDTEVVAGRAIELSQKAGPGARVLDLCAGSGCIGLAVAQRVPEVRVVLADLDQEALRLCRANTRRWNLSRRVVTTQADARLDPPGMLGEFDLIVSNPPYIPTGDIPSLDPSVRDFEPHLALDGGADGLDFYRSISRRWKSALKEGGTLLFEVGAGQADGVEQILTAQGYHDIDTRKDTGEIWRCVEGRFGFPPPPPEDTVDVNPSGGQSAPERKQEYGN